MATKESLTPGYPRCQRLFMRGSRFRFFSRFRRSWLLRPKICRPAADTEAISPQARKRPLVSRLAPAVLCTEFKYQPSGGTESLARDSQNTHEVSKNTYSPYSLGTGSCTLFKWNKFSAKLYFLNHEGAFAFLLFPLISLRSRGKVWTENGRRFHNLTQKFWKKYFRRSVRLLTEGG